MLLTEGRDYLLGPRRLKPAQAAPPGSDLLVPAGRLASPGSAVPRLGRLGVLLGRFRIKTTEGTASAQAGRDCAGISLSSGAVPASPREGQGPG